MKNKNEEYLNVNGFDIKHKDKIACKKERIEQGFCWWDAYDIDVWFLYIMPRMLEYYKKHNNAFPTKLMEEYYEQNKNNTKMTENEFYSYNPDDTVENKVFKENCDSCCFDKWNEILDRMIFLFDECNDEKCSKKNEYFEHKNENTEAYFKRQTEIEKYQDKCKKEALELFVKYFDNLWI